MRNIICTLAILLITGCGGSQTGGVQLPENWEPTAIDPVITEFSSPTLSNQPSLEELKAALELELDKLGVDPTKASNSAPSGKGVDVPYLSVWYGFTDESQIDSVVISWTEQFTGDCDFNGEVNVADLQPLVLYWEQEVTYRDFRSSNGIDGYPTTSPEFSETQPHLAKDWVLGQVDSDNNGVINLADISGIAQHFQQSIGGYNIYRRKAGEVEFSRIPNPDDPGSPLTILRYQATQVGTANPQLARPTMFEFSDPDVTPGMREYYVVPADQNGVEGDVNPVVRRRFLHENLGDLPYTYFEINGGSLVRFFEPGTQIEVDISQCRARAEGSVIIEYGIDIDGDDIHDYVSHGNQPILITLTKEGLSRIRLKVTDSNGLLGFYETPIFVGTNHPSVLHMQVDTGDGFIPSNITVDSSGTYDPDGIDDISFSYLSSDDTEYTEFNTSLRIHEPGDYSCRMTVTDSFGVESSIVEDFSITEGGYVNPGWQFAQIEENLPTAAGNSGFVVGNISGRPAVLTSSHWDSETQTAELKYYQALDLDGMEWISTNISDNEPDPIISEYSKLREVNGVPAIAYMTARSVLDTSAKYSHALTADGVSWIEPIEITRGFIVAPVLGMSSGKPVIATGGFSMNIFGALDSLGDSWDEGQKYDGFGGLAFDWLRFNGQEVVILQGSQLAMRPQDSDASWGEPLMLPEDISGDSLCCAVCDGLLTFWRFSTWDYSSPPDYSIMQFQAQTNDARTWGNQTDIEIPGFFGSNEFDVIAIEGSPPWLCFFDVSRFELLVMQANDLQATSWGEFEIVTSSGNVGMGCKLVEVNGKPGIVYIDASTNKLMIAVK